MEVAREESGTQAVNATEVTTSSGLKYLDLVRGGGETPVARGYLLAADVRVTLGAGTEGQTLFDTANTGRPLAFFFGCVRHTARLCVVESLSKPLRACRAPVRVRSRVRCARA